MVLHKNPFHSALYIFLPLYKLAGNDKCTKRFAPPSQNNRRHPSQMGHIQRPSFISECFTNTFGTCDVASFAKIMLGYQ